MERCSLSSEYGQSCGWECRRIVGHSDYDGGGQARWTADGIAEVLAGNMRAELECYPRE